MLSVLCVFGVQMLNMVRMFVDCMVFVCMLVFA